MAAPHTLLLHRAAARTRQGRSPLQRGAEASAQWGSSWRLSLQDRKSLSKSTRFNEFTQALCRPQSFSLIQNCSELLGYVFTYIKILTGEDVRHLLLLIIPIFIPEEREHNLQSHELKLLMFSISFKWRMVSYESLCVLHPLPPPAAPHYSAVRTRTKAPLSIRRLRARRST